MKYLLLILPLLSCTNLKKEAQSHIVAGKCEKEFKDTHIEKGQGIWQQVTEGTGTTASYLVTGLGHSTDFLVTYAGGTLVTIAVCSPIILLEGASRTNYSSVSGDCVGKVGGKVYKAMDSNLGKKSQEGTAQWRCPNVDSIAEGLLKVASCYEKNGEIENAREQRREIEESKLFQTCLSDDFKKKNF